VCLSTDLRFATPDVFQYDRIQNMPLTFWFEYVLPGSVQKPVLLSAVFSFLLDSYNKQQVFTEFW
jgi:hypothetical protein